MKPIKSTFYIIPTLLAGVSIAQAGAFQRTNPGNNCVESDDTSPEIRYSGERADNDADGSNVFLCPAEHSSVSIGGNSLQVNQVYYFATVRDNHPTANVSCRLVDCFQGACTNGPTSSTSGTGEQDLLSSPLNTTFNHSVHVRCQVPGQAGGNGRSGVVKYTLASQD